MKTPTGNRQLTSSSLVAGLALFALSAFPAQASNQTWAEAGNGDWNTGGNWGGTPPGVSGTTGANTDTATFGSVGSVAHAVTDAITNRSLAQILFNGSTGAGGSYTIGSSSNTLYFNDLNLSGGTTANISITAGSNNQTIDSNLMITGAANSVAGNDLRVQTFSGYTGTLTLSGNIAASTGTPGSISGLRIVTSGSSSTTPGDNSGNVIVLSGNITDGTGKVGVSRARNGILILSGVDTYSGGFQLGADGNDGLSANSITEIGVDSIGSAGNVTSSAFGTGVINIMGGDISSNGAANRTIYNNFTTAGGTLYTGLTSGPTGALTFAGTGTLSNTLTIDTLTGTTISGSLVNGSSAGSLSKAGTSTLTLSGASTYTGSTTVFAGALTVGTGGAIDNANATSGALTVSSANNATLNISGGTVNVNGGAGNDIFNVGTGAGAGVVALSSGSLNVTGWTFVGSGSGATGVSTGGYGSFDMSGGTANFGGYFALNRTSGSSQTNSAGTGILNMTGGAINVTAGAFDVGAFADPTAAGSRGVADVSGGTVTVSGTTDTGHADIYVGEFSYGILNLSSGGVIQDNVAAYGMTVGAHSGATGIVNLNGGTLAVPYINTGTNTATSILNFNGGLLKSTSATTTFLTGLTGAYVYSGGGTIDNNGNAITIGQAFLAPTGLGVTSVSVDVGSGGSGYLDTPLVTFTGGTLAPGGAPATGYAVLTNGVVTSIVITNPGNYTSTSGLTVLFSGGGGSGATAGTPATAANTSGGLTFQGSSTTILTGNSTYTGATTVSAGTLQIGNGTSGSISNGSNSSVSAGATLAFDMATASSYTGAISDSGTVTGAEGSSITNTLGGAITGNGSFDQTGAGTTVLSSANGYSGGTTVGAGTLQVSGAGTLGNTSATLTVNGGVLDLNGTSQTVGSLGGSGGTILNNGTSNASLTIGNGNTTGSYAGTIADNSGGSNTHTLAIIKTGSASITFSSPNTYTGGTTISQGTLAAAVSNVGSTSGAFGATTGAITLGDAHTGASNPTLLINTAGVTVSNPIIVANEGSGTDFIGNGVSLIGAVNYTGNVTLDKAVTLESFGSTTVDFSTGSWTTNNNAVNIGTSTSTGSVEIDSAVATSGGVNVNDGTFIAGNTIDVTGGALAVGSAGTLRSTSSGSITGNATLTGNGIINLNSASNISGNLAVTGGAWNGAGSVTGQVTSSSGTFTIGSSGNLTANGGLSVTGGTIAAGGSSSTITGSVNYTSSSSGTFTGIIAGSTSTLTMNNASSALTLTNANTYGGGTTVAGGSLFLNNTSGSSAGTGSLTVNGGGILGGTGSYGTATNKGAGFSISGTGTSTGNRANVLVGMGSASDTNTVKSLSLIASSTGTIANANLTFNLNDQVAGQGTELNVGSTAVAFGAGVQSTTLTLNIQNIGVIGANTFYVLIAGNTTGAVDQYSGLSLGTPSGNLASGLLTQILNSGSGQTGNLTLALNGLDQTWYGQHSTLFLYQNSSTGADDIEVEIVPEPGTWALMLGGLATLVFWQTRRRKD